MKKYLSLILAFVLFLGCVQFPALAAWQQADGNWYYYNNNKKVTGWFAYGPYWYYMNSAGEMQTGWLYYGAKWYYLDQTSGRMVTSKWIQDAGKWYYFDANGHMVTGWLELGSVKYYLKPDGSMVTGTYTIDGKQHSFSSSGAWMGEASTGKTGWAQEGGKWYYYQKGVKATGWLLYGKAWYYLKPNGEMQTGWLLYGKTWYYMESSGAMVTGWRTIGKDTYYFYSSGAMAADTTVDGVKIGPDGKALTEAVDLTTPEGREAAQAEIRYALSLLLDRNYLIENILQGGQLPANTFVANGIFDFGGTDFSDNANGGKGYYSVSAGDYTKNFAEAVAILKKYYNYNEATGKFTNFPTLEYSYNTNDGNKLIAEYIRDTLASVGIHITLENQEWNTFLTARKEGEYTIARNGWIADYTDPICFLEMWTTDSGNNDVQFGRDAHATLKMYDLDLTNFGYDIKVSNGTWAQTYDVLIQTIKACTSTEIRYKLMHMAEDMLMATGCVTPIYYYTDLYMLNSKVEGFYATPLGNKFFQKTTVDGKGDSLAVCLASDPYTLDPALNSSVDGATMLCHLFSGLAKWEQKADGTLAVVADCATELVKGIPNSDGTVTYTYTLKEGLKWSDGQPLTAKDFEFAWKRAASNNLSADYGYMFDVIKGFGTEDWTDPTAVNLAVVAKDSRTLEVTLNSDVAYWNELLAFPTYFPVREDVVANENWATNASTYVCNGAYTMTNWEHCSVITLTKNNNYHGAKDVTMNRLDFYLADDATTMLYGYQSGQWLLIDDVPMDQIANLKITHPKEFVITGQLGTYYACWNVNKSLLPEK